MKKRKTYMVIIIEIIILSLLYYFMNSSYIEQIPPCWVNQRLGILCPSCGGTRCVKYLLQGNWLKAFSSHSIFCIGILYLVIFNIILLINYNKEKKIAMWFYPKGWYSIIFAIALIGYTILRNLL